MCYTILERKSIQQKFATREMTNVQKANNSDLEFTVSYMLKDIGVPANLKGYPYLCEAIIAVLNDISLIRAVTKRL